MILSNVSHANGNTYIVVRANNNHQDFLTITVDWFRAVSINDKDAALNIVEKEAGK